MECEFTIKQISDQTGLNQATIRYYEKIGLINHVKRNSIGRRVYDIQDRDIINSIVCLKKTGMTLDEITSYMKLENVSEKYKMLQEHKKKINSQMTELQRIIELKLKKINNQ